MKKGRRMLMSSRTSHDETWSDDGNLSAKGAQHFIIWASSFCCCCCPVRSWLTVGSSLSRFSSSSSSPSSLNFVSCKVSDETWKLCGSRSRLGKGMTSCSCYLANVVIFVSCHTQINKKNKFQNTSDTHVQTYKRWYQLLACMNGSYCE